ncbi:MAG: site-specific integrase [Rhizomicrobium sp.]|jgi:integrase
MAFLLDAEELKSGLIIFRRADVKHRNFYCRIKLPHADRYKVVSLKTPDREAARDRAFDYDADIRFRIKHEVPVFNRPFSQIALDYVETQKERAETGHIGPDRAKNVESIVRGRLIPFTGSKQIHLVTQADWDRYPVWRTKTGKGVVRERVSDWTIRTEMSVLRSIMVYAASKKYIPENHIPKGNLHSADERREEFTREEYRKLHTFARGWVKEAKTAASRWYREMVYNFVLIMCNTGMRPPEAKNLRWRDVSISMVRKDTRGRESLTDRAFTASGERDAKDAPDQRKVVVLSVRGKDKYRSLVAASNVADYLERIRAIAKAKEPDDYVFTARKGKQAKTLYSSLVHDLLEDSGLLIGPAGTARSTYCFRHTYATMRLSEGIDVYLLAEQMGTSVQMIEEHYGHITPVKNADRILQGMYVWESTDATLEDATDKARVKAGTAAAKGTKSKRKERPSRR